ncbi:MAG: protein SanA [Verrucomicrobiaceae bacterium]|nr:protein SanA [Verrucomicrobiaceae bacterium]
MKLKRWLKIVGLLAVATVIFTFVCQFLVLQAANGRLYDSSAAVPDQRVALLLGCVKTLGNNLPNRFFAYRIKATTDLFKAGKIKAVLVSGDNSHDGYDEPTDMKEALIAAGVPESKITCDYAGFRTLDSVVRARKVFGQTQVIIISQRFHNERALYLAKCYGLDAIAFNAQSVELEGAPKTYIREVFARVKAVMDVHVLHTQPKFLGPLVKLERE